MGIIGLENRQSSFGIVNPLLVEGQPNGKQT